jgi:hypothetical protein
MKKPTESAMRNPILAVLIALIILVGYIPTLAQTQDENTYDWLSSSPDGNWTGSGSRWQAPGGGSGGGPTANRILRFNNNHYTVSTPFNRQLLICEFR